LKKSGKEVIFFDAEGKRIKPLFNDEKKEIVLTKQPYYVAVKNDVKTSLEYNTSRYVNIQGEKIPYLKPLYKEGIVFYDKIKIDFQRQEFLTLTLITPSEEVYNTNDLSEFEKFQVYSEEKIIYVFKEKPRLLGNFHIKYKNKIYKMGEIIEGSFGRFKVEIVYIDKEKTKIEENILKVNIKNSEIVDKTYVKLFNNCGFFIVTFEVRKNK